jgi:hypothetical protein
MDLAIMAAELFTLKSQVHKIILVLSGIALEPINKLYSDII